MGIKKIKKYKHLPFEEGKTYTTKFQTKDKFTITKIKTTKDGRITGFDGIYLNHPDLGPCPLPVDRLHPETVEDGEIEVCDHCGKPV